MGVVAIFHKPDTRSDFCVEFFGLGGNKALGLGRFLLARVGGSL
jgi:hypothetical protein